MVTPSQRFQLDTTHAGQRLDKVLASLMNVGRRHVRALFAADCVRVDSQHAAPSHACQPGQRVDVLELPRAESENEFSLRIVSMTDALVVVDKPAGQPSVPLPHRQGNSLAEALLARFGEMAQVGYRESEAGLLHRLDTQTSGLLLAARTRPAFEELRQGLQAGKLHKRYHVIVPTRAETPPRVIDVPLRPHPGSRRRVSVCRAGETGKNARTEIELLQRGDEWSLLDVSVAHAYRHQIRVHLAHVGLPLAGDTLYGGSSVAALGVRHALHAHHIAWSGGHEVPAFSSESPLPQSFVRLLG